MSFGTSDKSPRPGLDTRLRNVAVALVLALCVLVTRLWYLQGICGAYYAARAEKQRLFPQRLNAPRGRIYGRNGVILADNRPAWDLVLVPAETRGVEREVCERLERLIRVDAEVLVEEIAKRKRQPFEQVIVKQDIPKSELVRTEEYSAALPGVFALVRPQRRYHYGRVGGQILGYINELRPRELERRKDRYVLGDWIGRAGLEKVHEDRLKGRDGQMVVTRYADARPQLRTYADGRPYIVDTFGRKLDEETRRIDAMPGEDIYVTLDIELQAFAEDVLGGKTGAIVVLEADTGAVLALASTPGYDPSVFVTFSHDRDRQVAEALARDKINRAFQERYPPASVFKVLMAVAALETPVSEGGITEDTTFYCPGHYDLPGHRKRCWRWKFGGHGTVDVVDALAYSCDVFFFNVGHRLGVDRIHDWARRLGFGEKTGIDLPGETPGVVPSKAWKEQHFRADPRWYVPETLDFSIGQGFLSTTPLQNAVMMAAVINGGRRLRPYLVEPMSPQEPAEPLVSPRTLELVRAGLRKCVNKDDPVPRGTGWYAKIPGMDVLGKTGTAQVAGKEHFTQYEREEDIPYALRDHALFVAGVLDREPRIVVSVVVEHGLHGGQVAGPLAREVIEYFYEKEPQDLTVAKREEAP